MAEAAAPPAVTTAGGWTKHVTCRYFLHGVCKEGENCRYSHDLKSSKPVTMICKFYQKGACAYGERCRFEHSKVKEELPLPSHTPTLKSRPESKLQPEPGTGPGARPETGSETGTGVGLAPDWVLAAEFVPGQPYCGRDAGTENVAVETQRKTLCPYAAVGECRYGVNCAYLHGDVCDMCGLQVLHPSNGTQRSEHTKACMEAHEKDMELSFAVQRSKDMVCGVCMEVVFEKQNLSERRFGILSHCCHCYCLRCIRKWRRAKQFESKIIKSCPECRITSNFVIPSEYWVEDKEDKQKLIQKYKDGMGTKACRYFDEGRGSCPFGSNCFYKHAFPDGRLEEALPPRQRSHRNRTTRGAPFWDLLDSDDEELVTFELSEMLLMLLAAGAEEDEDSDDEWDLFHEEELEDFYEIYL
ncbi:unnamed protein product [Knipowitschia caucasica]|uniref:RING-type E3 ubiquitin transferase n=1 Tax=Knipowitschia caucasica TaxID=637954 RepID=A0AAV2ISX1_KNICA